MCKWGVIEFSILNLFEMGQYRTQTNHIEVLQRNFDEYATIEESEFAASQMVCAKLFVVIIFYGLL